MKLRYVQAWVDDEGRAHHYFRRPGFKRVPLPGLPGSREFLDAYQLALDSAPAPVGAKRTVAGSVSAAVVRYYASSRYFGSLAPGTQAMRRAILERFRAKHGDKPIAALPPKFIALTLDQMKPFAARNWLKSIRHLMQFAVSADMIKIDPTAGIKAKVPKTDGIHSITEEEIAQYEATHPIGSKARLAFALPLYTAQRRSDIIRIGRQHTRKSTPEEVADGFAHGFLQVRQQKTGAALSIPVHAELCEIIDATPGDMTLLTTKTGRPYSGNDFSGQFRVWCDQAGLPDECSVHGLRKAACRRLAHAGCGAPEIAAISGHRTLSEVSRYVRDAEQAKMARNAMARQRTKQPPVGGRFANDQATSSVKLEPV